MHATVMTSRTRQVRRKLLEAEPREAEPDAARRGRAVAVPRPCAIIRTWGAPYWRIDLDEMVDVRATAAQPLRRRSTGNFYEKLPLQRA